MRIAIAGQTYDTCTNGQGVFTVRLAEGLVRAGHQVAVLAPSRRARSGIEERGGVRVHALASLSLAPLYNEVRVTPFAARQARRLLREIRPDVVHIQDHYPLCRGVLRAALAEGLPVVATNHFLPENMAPYVPLSWVWPAAVEWILWRGVLGVLGRASLAAAPSETAAKILRQQGLRVPVCAVSCGVELERFRPEDAGREAVRAGFGLDPKRTLLLYVGRLDREKRLDVLIEALRLLRRSDLQLAVAGKGRDAAALQALAGRQLPPGQARFLGFVPDERLPGLLASADIFCMPSEAELQSIATLEAMAAGRAVLAANARALPELVHDGVTGRLFAAGDAASAAGCVAWLADHPAERARLGMAGRAVAERHAVEQTVQRYEALYACAERSEWQAAGAGAVLPPAQTERSN